MYPFFIECSKYYQDQPYKQLLLQQFAFGRGGSFIVKRKDKDILVTSDGEFIIPSLYSEISDFSNDISIYDPAVYDNIKHTFKLENSIKKKIKDFHIARLELDRKLWIYDEYDHMQENIKNLRISWNTTKKKDKLYLFYKYISNLDLTINEKIILCNLITLTLLLKLVKPSDVLYKDFIIQDVNQDLLTTKRIDAIEFSNNYSFDTKIKKINLIENEDDDEY